MACGAQSSSVTPTPTPTGPFTVSGHVFDAVTKAPLAGMTISLAVGSDANGVVGGFTLTDAQGAYVLPNRRPGPLRIQVFGIPGYDLGQQTIDVQRDVTLDFPLSKLVPATYTLSGHITDIATGMPLAGVTLDVLGDKNNNRSAVSGADGFYQLAGLFIEGFTLRARYAGYDSEFRGVQRSEDGTLDIQMRREMQSLSGTWTGSWAYTADDAQKRDQIPQMQLTQSGTQLSGGATSTESGNGFTGSIRDLSAIGSTTQLTGTLQMFYLQATGRGTAVQCVGTGAFTGTVNWSQLTVTASHVDFPCRAPYTGVTLSLTRQR